jgi:hypothetical protein
MRAVLGELPGDVLVHLGYVIKSIESSRDSGLITHHRDWDSGPVEPGYCLGCTVNKFDTIDRADVSVVNDDRSIPIEKHAGPS